ILDATEELMVSIGYGCVSTRKIAREISVTSALVHYYFPTTDDLFIEVYRRAADRKTQLMEDALASDQPIRGLWVLLEHPERIALGMELMALANHRPALRKEIAGYLEKSRKLQVETMSRMSEGKAARSESGAWDSLTLTM